MLRETPAKCSSFFHIVSKKVLVVMTIKGCQGVTIPGKVQLPLHQTETIIEEHSRTQCKDEQILGTPASMCSSCVYDSGNVSDEGVKTLSDPGSLS